MVGIKSTNKGINPDKDNIINLRDVKRCTSNKELARFLKNPNNNVFSVTASEVYACTILNFKKQVIVFPEPNPVAFYYSLAKAAVYDIEAFRDALEMYYIDKERVHASVRNDVVLFSYIFKIGTVGIIFCFSAIEALLNQMVPDHYETIRKNKKITKEQVQRYYSFDEKITRLMPEITGKDFCKRYPGAFKTIKQLKMLRDDLIHLKSNREKRRTYYTRIYQELLDVDLRKIAAATKLLVNFYERGLIVEKRKKKDV